jgi:hypothetical protein
MNRPTYLNLASFGIIRDIRKYIYAMLDPLDRIMVQIAHNSKLWYDPTFWCIFDVTVESCACDDDVDKAQPKCRCWRDHEETYAEVPSAPVCNWGILKKGCAKRGYVDLLSRAINDHPNIHANHYSGRDFWYYACTKGKHETFPPSIYEIGSEYCDYKYFLWERGDIVLANNIICGCANDSATINALKWIRSRGATLSEECYDSALGDEKFVTAEYIAATKYTCWCGKPAHIDIMFENCQDHRETFSTSEHRATICNEQTWRYIIGGTPSLNAMNYLYDRGEIMPMNAIIKYVNEKVIDRTLKFKHLLKIVKWMVSHGICIKGHSFLYTYYDSRDYKMTEYFDFLDQNGCKPNIASQIFLQLPPVAWAHQRGYIKWTLLHSKLCAIRGRWDLLEYATSNGCPYDHQTLGPILSAGKMGLFSKLFNPWIKTLKNSKPILQPAEKRIKME